MELFTLFSKFFPKNFLSPKKVQKNFFFAARANALAAAGQPLPLISERTRTTSRPNNTQTTPTPRADTPLQMAHIEKFFAKK